jgi:hypothetical protein
MWIMREYRLVLSPIRTKLTFRTDELIQHAIRQQFKESTVLTVAHRLRTVIDNDRIMVGHQVRNVPNSDPFFPRFSIMEIYSSSIHLIISSRIRTHIYPL